MSMRKMVGPIPAGQILMPEARAAPVVHAQTHPAGHAMIDVANAEARIQPHRSWTLMARLFWAMMANRVLRPGQIVTAAARAQLVDAQTTRHKIVFRVKSQPHQARNARVLADVVMAPIQIKLHASRARNADVAHAVKAADQTPVKTRVNAVIAPQVSPV